jgi:hypothetical protein
VSAAYTDFAWARSYRDGLVRRLRMVRESYIGSDLPPQIKSARLRAIDSKIEAALAIGLDEKAHPWVEDGVIA